MSNRGRHQSSCKDGKKTLRYLESIKEVDAVIIGLSIGGKSIGKNKSAGYLKLQREEKSGFKALLQTSKGVQEVFIKIKDENKKEFKEKIAIKFI